MKIRYGLKAKQPKPECGQYLTKKPREDRGPLRESLDLYACMRLQMNVEFACVRNSVLGMRAHAKLETGHVTEMSSCPSSGCPSSALSTSS